MTVEELISELGAMPLTALVFVDIRKNEEYSGDMMTLEDPRECAPLSVTYERGIVLMEIDE